VRCSISSIIGFLATALANPQLGRGLIVVGVGPPLLQQFELLEAAIAQSLEGSDRCGAGGRFPFAKAPERDHGFEPLALGGCAALKIVKFSFQSPEVELAPGHPIGGCSGIIRIRKVAELRLDFLAVLPEIVLKVVEHALLMRNRRAGGVERTKRLVPCVDLCLQLGLERELELWHPSISRV
jgi:hypothetical protein